jgi:hypothetical protein
MRAVDTNTRDAAVAASLLLQHGSTALSAPHGPAGIEGDQILRAKLPAESGEKRRRAGPSARSSHWRARSNSPSRSMLRRSSHRASKGSIRSDHLDDRGDLALVARQDHAFRKRVRNHGLRVGPSASGGKGKKGVGALRNNGIGAVFLASMYCARSRRTRGSLVDLRY